MRNGFQENRASKYKLISDEIPLDRADQSTTFNSNSSADRAIDNDPDTRTCTKKQSNPWLRVYFKSVSYVEKVVIEKGFCRSEVCTFSVSVYDGELKTLCGTYTDKSGEYYNETVQCGGKRGDSLILEMSACGKSLIVYEIHLLYAGKLLLRIR